MEKQKCISLLSGTEEGIRWVTQIRIKENAEIPFPDLFQQDIGSWQREYRNKNRNIVRRKEREYYKDNLLKERRRAREKQLFRKVTKELSGICWECGEIDWCVLEGHHPDRIKLPNFKVTMCANCHTRLHWYLGNGVRKNG